jgi:LmbE family N-acetylglucosaminyl deacetylase
MGATAESAEGKMLNRSALVVAHPDDEILWFSSIVDQVDLVVICFLEVESRPDWTQGRREAARAFPLPNVVFLGLSESEVFNGADWMSPVLTEYGLDVRPREGTLPAFSAERYRANYAVLERELLARLDGYQNVFTHNPWGEYGHEEHVQVHRVVRSLQQTLGFSLWCSNYCSNKSYPLMLRYVQGFKSPYVMRQTNPKLAGQIERLYRANGCWTWPFNDYEWFAHECFAKDIGDPKSEARAGRLGPLNLLRIEAPWEATSARERRSPLRRIGGRIRSMWKIRT